MFQLLCDVNQVREVIMSQNFKTRGKTLQTKGLAKKPSVCDNVVCFFPLYILLCNTTCTD